MQQSVILLTDNSGVIWERTAVVYFNTLHYNFPEDIERQGTGVAQSVQRRARGWTARIRFPQGQETFLYSTVSRPIRGPNRLPIQWVLRSFPWGIMQQGREADHSSSTEVKESGAISPLLLCFHGIVLN
jgi:hypothetical protein